MKESTRKRKLLYVCALFWILLHQVLVIAHPNASASVSGCLGNHRKASVQIAMTLSSHLFLRVTTHPLTQVSLAYIGELCRTKISKSLQRKGDILQVAGWWRKDSMGLHVAKGEERAWNRTQKCPSNLYSSLLLRAG